MSSYLVLLSQKFALYIVVISLIIMWGSYLYKIIKKQKLSHVQILFENVLISTFYLSSLYLIDHHTNVNLFVPLKNIYFLMIMFFIMLAFLAINISYYVKNQISLTRSDKNNYSTMFITLGIFIVLSALYPIIGTPIDQINHLYVSDFLGLNFSIGYLLIIMVLYLCLYVENLFLLIFNYLNKTLILRGELK